jgi:calcyclin binding protein
LNGKNYRLIKDNLDKDIVPEKSKFLVKKNKVVIKLQKVKGEYSFEHWTNLTSKKGSRDKVAEKKDPSASIMDMMKDMYNDGDDNMKKIIGEAMMKSRSGEKMDMPTDPL